MEICVCTTPQEEEFNERIRTQGNQFRYAVVVEQREGIKQKIPITQISRFCNIKDVGITQNALRKQCGNYFQKVKRNICNITNRCYCVVILR